MTAGVTAGALGRPRQTPGTAVYVREDNGNPVLVLLYPLAVPVDTVLFPFEYAAWYSESRGSVVDFMHDLFPPCRP